MKIYRIITKGNGSLINQALYGRYMIVDPKVSAMWLIATPTLPQGYGYGLGWMKPDSSEEMELKDHPWLFPHLPKEIKKIVYENLVNSK